MLPVVAKAQYQLQHEQGTANDYLEEFQNFYGTRMLTTILIECQNVFHREIILFRVFYIRNIQTCLYLRAS